MYFLPKFHFSPQFFLVLLVFYPLSDKLIDFLKVFYIIYIEEYNFIAFIDNINKFNSDSCM